MSQPLSILCIASYFKGEKFMIACKQLGCKVYLVTSEDLKNKAWPRQYLDDIFFVPCDENKVWNMEHVINGLAYVMQHTRIDRIVALDDFDVEKGALLREHFRIPGMGQTTARYFRDKLAMRKQAQDEGIRVPAFSDLFFDEDIRHYVKNVAAPWVVKPRHEASATGIKKLHNEADLWEHLKKIGETRHNFLIEQFKPGHVYHVDALSQNGKVLFARSSQYLSPPFEVMQGGGIFRSHTIAFNSPDDKALQKMNAQVMKAFGMRSSASHTEFIKCNEDGQFYFLETSARVGGANLMEMLEASAGINLWTEWAKLEVAVAQNEAYTLPPVTSLHSGIITSLARSEHPDTSSFKEPEIFMRPDIEYHICLILQSKSRERVLQLLDDYVIRIQRDYHAALPPLEKPRV